MTFYHEAPEPKVLEALLTRLGDAFALDTETALVPHCFKPGRIRTIQFHSDTATLGFDVLAFNGVHWEVLRKFLTQPHLSIYGHNLAFDYHVLWVNDIELRGQLYDSMIASTVIHNGASNVKHNLVECVRRELGVQMDKTLQAQDWLLKTLTAEDVQYALDDVRHTWDLCHLLHERVGAEGLEGVYRLERSLIPALTALNHYGVPLDDEAIHAAVDEYAEATEEARIAYLETLDGRLQDAGAGFLPRNDDGTFNCRAKASGSVRAGTKVLAGYNVSSSQQTLAFWKLVDLEPVDDTGKPTTDKNVLARNQSDELVRLYLGFRRVERRLAMAKKLIEHRGPDGRIHSNFMPLVTGTGRFTSNGPNLQNVPRDSVFRCAIKPPAGRVLVQADYSAMELRVAAAIAGEQQMLAAFREGADIHSRTAARMFGIEEQEVSKNQRQQAKALNFGALYGSSSAGIQNYCATLGQFMTQRAAGELLKAWHAAYPAFGKWHWQCQQRADMAEPVRTLLGRRRKLFGADNRVTTQANNQVQGTSADIMKAALIEIHRNLPETAWLIAVVHDEVLVECDDADGPAVLETVLYEMKEAAVPFFGEQVALEAEGGVYASWGEK